MKSGFCFLTIFLFLTASVHAQLELPRLSPQSSVSLTVGYTKVTIDYCSPAVKERKIWGELVPYNQVWRTGANEATTIHLTTDATIEGQIVPAGKYSLFTIPGDNGWIVILNKTSKQWGAFNYKKEDDLLRFEVKPERNGFNEHLEFSFSNITDNSASVLLKWEQIQVSFKIEVDLRGQTLAKIKEAIASKPDDWQVYTQSANYAADNDFYLEEALQWTDKAIALDGGYFPYFVKAKILYREKSFTQALNVLEKCRDIGRSDKNWNSFVAQIDFLENQIKTAAR